MSVPLAMAEDRLKDSKKQVQDDSPISSDSDTNAPTKTDNALDWLGPNDPDNPKNFSPARKCVIVGAAILVTLLIPMNGTSITVATDQIDARFNISDSPFPNSYWTVVSWTLGGALFVMIGIPLLEDLGVRLGFLVFYAFFLLMMIPQALAQNFATLVVSRFFAGGCISLLANTASSMIPDMWSTERQRSLPLSIWILAYLLGYTIGPPVFAGFIQHHLDWRWIFYAQLIIYGSLFPVFWFCIQETRSNVILRCRAKASKKDMDAFQTTNFHQQAKQLARASIRPMYLLFTEPLLLAVTIWEGFCFGTVFLFTQSVAQIYGPGGYGWPSWDVGYVQAAVAVGEVLGWFLSLYGTRLYFQSASRNTECPGHPIPEARLYISIFGSFAGITGGMFVYAWTPSVHWILPTIGLAMVGFGIETVVSVTADYIEDAYAASDYAASAISAAAVGENVMAGLLPLATLSMYTTLGNEWASTLLGFLALLLSFAPVWLIWKGRSLRERSPFMSANGRGCEMS